MATKVETTKSQDTEGEGTNDRVTAKAQSVDDKAANHQPELQTNTPTRTLDDGDADGDVGKAISMRGRAVFAVETTAAGVVVRTAILTQENKLLNMPAVFPDLMYAMSVIDDLKRQVMQHFSQAAQVGAQVIASQSRTQQQMTAVNESNE